MECGLHATCRSPFVRTELPTDTSNLILIVGEAPGSVEDFEGVPFADENGMLLRKALRKMHLIDHCGFAYVVRCRPVQGKVQKSQIKACCSLLLQEIERLRPKAILCVGATAMTAITGRGKIADERRKILPYTLQDGTEVPVVVTFSPAYVMRAREIMPQFEGDIKFLQTVHGGTDPHAVHANILRNYIFDPTEEQVAQFVAETIRRGEVAQDFETGTTQPFRGRDWLVMLGSFYNGKSGIVVRFDPVGQGPSVVRNTEVRQGGTEAYKWRLLKKTIGNPRVKKYMHNAKYDCHISEQRFGVRAKGRIIDTQVLHALVHQSPNDLDSATSNVFGVAKYKGVTDSYTKDKEKEGAFTHVPFVPLSQRNAQDTYWTYKLAHRLQKDLATFAQKQLACSAVCAFNGTELLENIIYPATNVLLDMERTGFLVDQSYIKKLALYLNKRAARFLQHIQTLPTVRMYNDDRTRQAMKELNGKKNVRQSTVDKRLAECVFNPASGKQLQEILYGAEYYNCSVQFRTATDSPATHAEALQAIRDDQTEYEEVKRFTSLVQAYKQSKHLRSTYCLGYQKRLGVDGRLHCRFNLGVARTGRLSSADPNLQNVPGMEDAQGRLVFRRMFVPKPGCVLVDADYSQIELRILAALSGDRNMIAVFQRGDDLHNETALYVFDLNEGDSVTKSQRRAAKAVNFGVVYGESAMGLSANIKVSVAEAENFIRRYYERFPDVMDWQEAQRTMAMQHGCVWTLTGRRRLLENARIRPSSGQDRGLIAQALRQAVNMPIQGTASDINVLAVIALRKAYAKLPYYCKLVTTVHDNNVTECDENHVAEVVALKRDIMVNVPTERFARWLNGVPIVVDVSVGKSWGVLEKVE